MRDSRHLLDDADLTHADVGNVTLGCLVDSGLDLRPLQPFVADNMRVFPLVTALTARLSGCAANDVVVHEPLETPW
jgi:hypothetical protein